MTYLIFEFFSGLTTVLLALYYVITGKNYNKNTENKHYIFYMLSTFLIFFGLSISLTILYSYYGFVNMLLFYVVAIFVLVLLINKINKF